MRAAGRFILISCLAIFFFFSVRSGGPAEQHEEVAITVDDLPAHGPLPPGMTRVGIAQSFVATLRAKHVPPVYGFMNTNRGEGPTVMDDVLNAWVNSGNLLGNHTATHMDLATNTAEQFEENIAANESALKAAMGKRDWHWFRYPYLHEGETVEKRQAIRKYLRERGYRIAEVTLDFGDYAWNDPYARCVQKEDQASIAWLKSSYLSTAAEYVSLDRKLAQLVYGREIKHVLLLHIGALDSIMLPQLLDFFKERGFRFVTLPKAESDAVYQADTNAALPFGGTLLEQMVEGRHLDYPQHAPKPMEKLDAICR